MAIDRVDFLRLSGCRPNRRSELLPVSRRDEENIPELTEFELDLEETLNKEVDENPFLLHHQKAFVILTWKLQRCFYGRWSNKQKRVNGSARSRDKTSQVRTGIE